VGTIISWIFRWKITLWIGIYNAVYYYRSLCLELLGPYQKVRMSSDTAGESLCTSVAQMENSVAEGTSKQVRKYTHNNSGTIAICFLFVNHNRHCSVNKWHKTDF